MRVKILLSSMVLSRTLNVSLSWMHVDIAIWADGKKVFESVVHNCNDVA